MMAQRPRAGKSEPGGNSEGAVTLETFWQLVGVFLAIGIPVSGAVFAVLKMSIGRHIANMDAKFAEVGIAITEIRDKVDMLAQRYEGLKGDAVSKPECAVCRQTCQSGMVEWMRRIEDKIDRQADKNEAQNERIIMMVANMNNGGGR